MKMFRLSSVRFLGVFSILIFMTSSCVQSQPLETVPNVDLARYMGKWYEIASFPQRFQKGCTCTTAEYTLTDKDYVIVVNRCRKDSVNGKEVSISGKAFIDKGFGNARLKVQFFWPFKGKYWIIDLADDYSYAVVSHPNRKYLWILSRTPSMDPVVYAGIIERLKAKGLDTGKLARTVHAK